MNDDLKRLLSAAEGTIELTEMPQIAERPAVPPVAPQAQQALPEPPRFGRHIAVDWRISSFSALTRDIHQVAHGGSARGGGDPVLEFPAGSHVGSFLHLLLENLDFQGDIASQTRLLSHRFAPRFALDLERYQQTLVNWMQDLVATRLDDQGLCLSALPARRRLNELAFDFSIGGLDVAALDAQLRAQAGRPLETLGEARMRGLLTGFIDLVFEYQGRFYIADYKSNFLGASMQDYEPERLQQAVYDRRYDLQYMLYCVALHRYLGQRLPDYQYARDFGGVYYLFLRAMRAQTGRRFGVFFSRPDESLVVQLDQCVLAPGGRADDE